MSSSSSMRTIYTLIRRQDKVSFLDRFDENAIRERKNDSMLLWPKHCAYRIFSDVHVRSRPIFSDQSKSLWKTDVSDFVLTSLPSAFSKIYFSLGERHLLAHTENDWALVFTLFHAIESDDPLGDVEMTSGIKHLPNLLKISLLNRTTPNKSEVYQVAYDLVICDSDFAKIIRIFGSFSLRNRRWRRNERCESKFKAKTLSRRDSPSVRSSSDSDCSAR